MSELLQYPARAEPVYVPEAQPVYLQWLPDYPAAIDDAEPENVGVFTFVEEFAAQAFSTFGWYPVLTDRCDHDEDMEPTGGGSTLVLALESLAAAFEWQHERPAWIDDTEPATEQWFAIPLGLESVAAPFEWNHQRPERIDDFDFHAEMTGDLLTLALESLAAPVDWRGEQPAAIDDIPLTPAEAILTLALENLAVPFDGRGFFPATIDDLDPAQDLSVLVQIVTAVAAKNYYVEAATVYLGGAEAAPIFAGGAEAAQVRP